jgi:hypothetical protein
MTDCTAYQQEVGEVAEGGVLSRGARTHVETCRACGERLRERESLRRLVGGLRKVEAPPDFEFRLRARIAATKTAGKRGPLGGLRILYGFAPVAAAACFLIVSASLYLRTATPTSPVAVPSRAVVERKQNSVDVQSPANNAESPANNTGSALREQVVSAAPTVASESVNGESHSTIASPSQPLVLRQRGGVRVMREVSSRSEGSVGQASNTFTADLKSAPVITSRTWKIPVGAPAEPLRMVVRDERGAERVIPMRTVSFGSQELIAREGARQRTSVADNEGVW